MRWIGQLLFGLRFRLLFLVLLVCGPLVALTVHNASDERRRQLEGWAPRAARVARAANREQATLVERAKQMLLAMALSSEVQSADALACKKLVDDQIALNPYCANIGVAATNGRVLASAVRLPGAGDMAGAKFLQRALETRRFSIGEIMIGPRNRPVVMVGYPALTGDNQVRAVAFAAVCLQHTNRSESEVGPLLIRGATWTQIDSYGTVLAGFPRPEQRTARPHLPGAVLNAALAGHESTLEVQDPSGATIVHGFATVSSPLGLAKVISILSVPRQTLFSQADQTLARNLMWLAGAGALALALGWFGSNLLIIRPIKTLVRTSLRLAEGDLSVRTGLRHGRDELGQLMLSFDRMAQSLEDREKERERASKKLQVLSHRLVEVQEAERRQIARELHDEIGQSLTAAEMNLQAALQSSVAVSMQRRLQASMQAVEHVLEQVHDLSLNLRPSMLDDLGLESALRWYTHRQAELMGIQAEFRPAALEQRVDAVIETECFRVAQEALTNVVRHSHAQSVVVELCRRNEHLHLTVRDDGVGFEVGALRDQAVRGASLGLLSMEERAALAGGGVEFISQPGKGTEVRAWFPLKWQGPQDSFATHE